MLGPHIPRRHSAAGGSPSSPKLMGRIMWLPTKEIMDLGFENGVYNHPVVVLSPMLNAGEVDFFSASCASSWAGKPVLLTHGANS
ncbi:hypothetical protein J3459_010160 [Metarhizium acridum]|nr:hypothetical protein J3459_010160 [Metarhizium acridum]